MQLVSQDLRFHTLRDSVPFLRQFLVEKENEQTQPVAEYNELKAYIDQKELQLQKVQSTSTNQAFWLLHGEYITKVDYWQG